MNAFQQIQGLVQELTGLDTSATGTNALAPALQRRMKALSLTEPLEYYHRLLLSKTELGALIEEIVVPETWFFRDRAAFECLAQHVRATWLPQNPDRSLRLLSVPCATGEEPFSIAMTLLDTGLPPRRFRIHAVDISRLSIGRARPGLFGKNSFRSHPLDFRDRYFRQEAEGYRLCEQVIRQVTFSQGNLLDPGFTAHREPYDIIFCRNLLIYLEAGAQRRALATLRRLLRPEGLLFAAYAEHGPMLAGGFKPLPFARAAAFSRSGANPAPPRPPAPAQARPQRTSAPVPGSGPGPAAPLPPVPVQEPPALTDIRRLADQGRTAEAMQHCTHYLQRHPADAEAHYLLGLLCDGRNQPEQAERHLRRAVYLQPDHHEALLHLALLARRQGDTEAAERFLKRARRVEQRTRQD